MGDSATVAAWAGVVATIVVGLVSPKFLEWWNSRGDGDEPITLGDLTAAKPLAAQPIPYLEADRAVLKHLLDVLPSDGMIDFLRTHNFGFAYRGDYLDPLDRYASESTRPEVEFLSERLEPLRKEFLTAIHKFQRLIATETFSWGPTPGFFRVPDEWEMQQPARYFRAIDALNAAATDVVRKYDVLVRAARKELLQ